MTYNLVYLNELTEPSIFMHLYANQLTELSIGNVYVVQSTEPSTIPYTRISRLKRGSVNTWFSQHTCDGPDKCGLTVDTHFHGMTVLYDPVQANALPVVAE